MDDRIRGIDKPDQLVLDRIRDEAAPLVRGKTIEQAQQIVAELVQREIDAGNLSPVSQPTISIEARRAHNVVERRSFTQRFGANRAEHRRNLRALKKQSKERAKVRAAHNANHAAPPGTFVPGPGFDDVE